MMTAAAPGDPRCARFRFWILALFLLLFVPVGILAKQAMASFFVAAAIFLLAAVLIERRRLPLPEKPVIAAFLLILLLAGIGEWVGGGGFAEGRLVEKLSLLLLLLVTVSAASEIRAGIAVRPLIFCLATGIWLGAAIYAVEMNFDAPLYRLFSGKGYEAHIALSRFNRGSTALVLLSWAAAAGLWCAGLRLAPLLTLLIGLAVALMGESASAGLAAIVGLLVLPLALLNARIASRIMMVLAAVLMLAAPWLFLHMLDWVPDYVGMMPPSFAERLEIWNAASVAATANPLLGNGIGAMRVLEVPDSLRAGYTFFETGTTHPHNAAVQIWLELGLFGILVVLVLLWRLMRATEGFSQPVRGAALSCLAAGLVIASVSYGLWQETWMGIIGFTILCFGILGRDDSASD